MSTLYDILLNDILSIFVDITSLNVPVGIANWNLIYLDIFKFLFTIIASYIVVWLFMILPFKILKKIMRYNEIKGGKR